MSTLSLQFKAYAGSDIAVVARELDRLSKILKVPCRCDFNGVNLMFCVGDSPAMLVDDYYKELQSKHSYKLATEH